jgi:hypothetical protein
MEAAETAYRDVANIWFGEIEEKAAKLLAMTFAVFSIPYLFYAKRPQGLAFQSRNDS